MKKFELLGRSLSKDQQKKILGGDESVQELGGTTCFTRCPSTGNMWGLNCPSGCDTMRDFPGAIRCEGYLYTWGCEGTNKW